MRRFGWTLCALLLTFGIHAHAETQLELNYRAAHDARKAEYELVGVMRRVTHMLEPFNRRRFEALHATWREYRKRECEYETSSYGDGSIAPLIYWQCFARMTRARAIELRAERESFRYDPTDSRTLKGPSKQQ